MPRTPDGRTIAARVPPYARSGAQIQLLGGPEMAGLDLSIIETVAIGEDFVGSLILGPGSTAKVDWTLTKPWEGCPAAGSRRGTIGTPSREGIDEQSQQDPDAIGLPIAQTSDKNGGFWSTGGRLLANW